MNFLKKILQSVTYFAKNKNYLFNFFIVSAIIGVGISYSNLYLFHILLVIYVFTYLLLYPINKFSENFLLSKYPTRLHYIIFFTIIWYSLMLIITENKFYGIKYLSFIIIGNIIIFIVVQKIKMISQLKNLYKTIAIIIIVEIIISLFESVGIFRWPISRLSENVVYFGRVNEITTILNESFSNFYVQTMPTGFHWNPNNLAVLMGMAFPFFIFHKNKWISIFGSIIIIWIVVQCGARLIFLSFYLMIFLSFLIINKKNIIVPFFVTIIIIFCSTNGFSLLNGKLSKFNEIQSFTFGLIGLNQPSFNKNNETSKTGSIALRKELIIFGINSSIEHYGIGVGGGNSQNELEKIGGIGEKKIMDLHNFWIELLMEGGIIFLLFFISWYCIILWKLFRIIRICKELMLSYLSKSSFVALSGFIVSAVAPSSVIYFFPMYILFGFSISTINIYKMNYENTPSIRY